ncbi:unnamed protein product, partial [Allacma fusca]
ILNTKNRYYHYLDKAHWTFQLDKRINFEDEDQCVGGRSIMHITQEISLSQQVLRSNAIFPQGAQRSECNS